MTVKQVLNTKGAARRLGCSETWIHKLVAKGELRAYIYDETGSLVERTKGGSKNKKLPKPPSDSQRT
jgi:excisionase family DNA binding protein